MGASTPTWLVHWSTAKIGMPLGALIAQRNHLTTLRAAPWLPTTEPLSMNNNKKKKNFEVEKNINIQLSTVQWRQLSQGTFCEAQIALVNTTVKFCPARVIWNKKKEVWDYRNFLILLWRENENNFIIIHSNCEQGMKRPRDDFLSHTVTSTFVNLVLGVVVVFFCSFLFFLIYRDKKHDGRCPRAADGALRIAFAFDPTHSWIASWRMRYLTWPPCAVADDATAATVNVVVTTVAAAVPLLSSPKSSFYTPKTYARLYRLKPRPSDSLLTIFKFSMVNHRLKEYI